MHTFFLEDIPAAGATAALDKRDEEHLFRTLRARVGEDVRLFDGKGRAASATVQANRTLRIGADFPPVRLPSAAVHLYLAVPRKNRMDQLLAQCAEVGVASITPVEFARSVATPTDAPDRWRVRLIEGCKQSGNPRLPEIRDGLRAAAAWADIAARGLAGFFGEIGGARGVPVGKVPSEAAWVVGPEGGFTPEEIECMRGAGFTGVRLGGYVLRLETAAVFGAALLVAAAENREDAP